MNSFIIIYCSALFFQIVHTFKRFSYKTKGLIKSLSGFLLPFIPSFQNPNSIIETDGDLVRCMVPLDDSENWGKTKCMIIIPGYMEHDPKLESIKYY